jgi:hypothetical protein
MNTQHAKPATLTPERVEEIRGEFEAHYSAGDEVVLQFVRSGRRDDGYGYAAWAGSLQDAWAAYLAASTAREADRVDAERWRIARSLEHCNAIWCAIGDGEANANLDRTVDAIRAARAPKETT